MTRRQHLQKLPLQKRLQAMEAIRKQYCDSLGLQNRMNDTCFGTYPLMSSFDFKGSRQGFKYWWAIQEKYFSE